MRIDKPIGFLLLLWPTLIALFLASKGLPSLHTIFLFSMGVWLMRAAGCVVNDLIDQKFDGFVERTKNRPLIVGSVSSAQAKVLLLVLLSLAFFIDLQLKFQTIMFSFLALGLAILYPFMKRYTYFPQVFLSVAFSMSIPMVYSEYEKMDSLDGWILFLATLCWVMAYDTQYAMVDKQDDVKIGVKSTAIFFKHYDRFAIFIFQLLSLSLFGLLGFRNTLGIYYGISLLMVFLLIIYQQKLIYRREPKKCFQAFLNNQWIGLLIFLGVLASHTFK